MRKPTSNFKLTIAYDGTKYGGWQRQTNAVTIQQLVEEAVAKLAGKHVTVHGSGRTDAGVHARAQVASCAFATRLSPATIRRALNAHLPEDIRVTGVSVMPAKFHARFSAKKKEYRYQIDTGKVANPFLRYYAWHHPRPLDLPAMRRAAGKLKGRHDFTSLSAKSSRRDAEGRGRQSERNPVRTIKKLAVTKSGNVVTVAVAADGFLYKMVRMIVARLVKVGEGRTAVIGETAPAKGLCLWKVWY